jgi:hypothetical protein
MAEQSQFLEMRLHAVEQAHKTRMGDALMCYHAVPFHDTGSWCLAVVRSNSGSYWPLSEDLFLGPQALMEQEAARLNRERLQLTERAAAMVVADSMRLSRPDRRGDG